MILQRGALALVGGLALFAAHPPWDLGWLAPIALVPLLALARRLNGDWRGSAGWGLVAGMVFFLPLLSWIGRFGVVPWVLLALIQAVYVAAWLTAVSAWGQRRWRPLFAAVAWVGLEAVRGNWPMGGFPWGILGYSQHDGGMFLPVARSLGVFGVSLALALVAVCVEEAGHRMSRALAARERGSDVPLGEVVFGGARTPLLAFLGVLVASVLLAGQAPAPTGRTLDIAGVQGNDQELPPLAGRQDLDRVERIVDRMLVASAPLADDPPELMVWPENSLDADTRRREPLRARVEQALEIVDGAPLIAGAMLDGPEPGSFVNAMVRYEPDGTIGDIAAKRRLVPFGEYVPGRRFLDWYPALRYVPNDGVAGTEPVVFSIGDALVAPITCYESLWGELVRDQVREGAEVLVVSTNNASFGRTAATWQHLAFSKLRAVETGRWIMHAGISGVSAVIDPEGDTSQVTELFEPAIVRGELPLISGLTPAMRLGDSVAWLSLGLALAAGVWALWDARRRAPDTTAAPREQMQNAPRG